MDRKTLLKRKKMAYLIVGFIFSLIGAGTDSDLFAFIGMILVIIFLIEMYIHM